MKFRWNIVCPILVVLTLGIGCEKTSTAPSVPAVAAFTVVNAIPNSINVVPVLNSGSPISYFGNAASIGYGSFYEYSPYAGIDTIYVVQQNSDTSNVSPKSAGLMYYNVLKLKVGGIYSLFLTGADTSSLDYFLSSDSLPYHNPSDSTVGIRFVNLSSGSNPISINLEGSSNGSEVQSLAFKSITGFKNYLCNSTLTGVGYLFVIRDLATGDSLTSYILPGFSPGSGIGLYDPVNNGNALMFKNITIAIYGSENPVSNFPLNAMLIDDY